MRVLRLHRASGPSLAVYGRRVGRIPSGLRVTSVALLIMVAGCSSENPPVHPTATVTECEASFSELESALAGDPNIDVAEAEAYTLKVCSSREQWLSTADQHGEVLGGREAGAALDEFCEKADYPADSPACSKSAG